MNFKRLAKSAAAGVVLLVTAREAQRGLSGREEQAYRAINDLPDSLAYGAWLPMQAGALAYPIVLSAGFYWRTRTLQPALSIAAAGISAWVGAKAVKKIVGRGRPFDYDPETNLRLWTETDGSLGFISGHAAVSFAVASVVSDRVGPAPGATAYAAAIAASLSRVYVGAHLPLDIVGGGAFGVLVGEASELVVTKLRSA